MKITISPQTRNELGTIYLRAVNTDSSKFFCTNLCLYVEKLYAQSDLVEQIESRNKNVELKDKEFIDDLTKQTLIDCKKVYDYLRALVKKHKIETKDLELNEQDISNLGILKKHQPLGLFQLRVPGIYATLEKVVNRLCSLNSTIKKELVKKYFQTNYFSDLPYYAAVPSFWRFSGQKARVEAIRGTRTYAHWQAISAYKDFVFEPNHNGEVGEMIYGEVFDGFKNAMNNDPILSKADWGDGDNVFFSPQSDRQSLMLFHDWLMTNSTASSTSNSEVEAEAGDYTAYQDGTVTFLGSKIELAVRPAEILRMFIGRPNERISCDEIIQSTSPVEQQQNSRRYHNLSQQIHNINKYMKDEFEVDSPISSTSEKTYRFTP